MSATVLCIHADRDLAQVHAETLEAEGFEVVLAHEGRQALDLLRRRTPDFVVLDALLPRMDGLEIVAEMRADDRHRTTPVLLVTAPAAPAPSPDWKAQLKDFGAVGVARAPLALERLVAVVRKQLKSEGETAAPVATASTGFTLPATGSLRDVPVPELIDGMRRLGFDGALGLEHGKKKKWIEFRDGWPTAVRSNLRSECLDQFLVREGLATPEALQESIRRMKAGEGLQGQILVATDVVEESALVEALRAYALEKLFEVFTWRDGRFERRAGQRVQRGSSLAIDGHPSWLVVEGVRRAFPIKQINRFLADHASGYLVPAPDGADALRALATTEEERAWLSGLDGRVRLGEIAGQDETLRRFVFGLLSVQVLRVAETAGDGGEAQRFAAGAATTQSGLDPEADAAARVELAERANRWRGGDAFVVLDVSPEADDDEVAVAYASLSRRFHPDRYRSASSSVRQLATQVFERIEEARVALADEAGRQRVLAARTGSGRVERLEDEGQRALAAETAFQKGEAKLAERDYEGALLCFGRAMENFPSEGEYRSFYGWTLHLCHPDNDVMLGEALEHCREGVKLAKDREKPYLLLGRLYKVMGKPVAAKRMFSRAVQIKPQCVEAMRELRIMNMRREGDQARGKGMLKRFLRR